MVKKIGLRFDEKPMLEQNFKEEQNIVKQINKNIKNNDEDLDKFNMLLYQYFVRNDYETCMYILDTYDSKYNFVNEQSLLLKGLMHRMKGEIKQSTDSFKRANALNFSNQEVIRNLGKSLILSNKLKLANECFEECYRNKKQDWALQHNTGLLNFLHENYEIAATQFRKANSSNLHESTTLYLLECLKKLGNTAEQLEVMLEHLSKNKQSQKVHTKLGLYYLETNNLFKAFESLNTACSIVSNQFDSQMSIGSIIQDNGDQDAAISKQKVIISEFPNSPELWNNIGLCFYGFDKQIASISCLRRANYICPISYEISFNLGLNQLKNKQYVSAFIQLTNSINLNDSQAPSQMQLGIVLMQMNQQGDSMDAFQHSLSLKKDLLCQQNFIVFLMKANEFEQVSTIIAEANAENEKNAENPIIPQKVKQQIMDINQVFS